MLDDFRQQAEEITFDDEEVQRPYRPKKYFLGMSPFQRFVLATMLLIITCVLSSFALLVTEKIVIPGF
jgi:hypothetical protein